MAELKHWLGFGYDHPLCSIWNDQSIQGLRETADILEKLDTQTLEVEFDNELDKALKHFAANHYASYSLTPGKIEVMLDEDGDIRMEIDLRKCFECLSEEGLGPDDLVPDYLQSILDWADYMEKLSGEIREKLYRKPHKED